MLKETEQLLKYKYRVKDYVFEYYKEALKDVQEEFNYYDEIREFNQTKVLNALQEERISESHFNNTAGYGYDDLGRDSLDKVYARVFNSEMALVRSHFVNGSHAIGCALFGNLRPGDTMMCISGRPYDTLHNIIGTSDKKNIGSLKEYGVNYKQVELLDGKFDFEKIKTEIENDESIKLIHIQRSMGYGWRKSFLIDELEEVIKFVKDIKKDLIVFVDNSYGEFTNTKEPTEVGADIVAGSLIKNIGGGIAPVGAYVAGTEKCVTQASYRLTIPGLGGEAGATLGVMRQLYQGLFFAPHTVMEAVKTSVFGARIMELAGFEVFPRYTQKRSDLVQAIKFGDREKLINFCKAIQESAPVDSFVQCEPAGMPGYNDEVIMASGSFVQGSSIELSADAPIREPYIAYMQGGVTFDHGKVGILLALNKLV